MNYQFVKQLIELAEQFEQEHEGNSDQKLERFTAWLTQKMVRENKDVAGQIGAIQTGETVDSVITKLITFMYRYARMYVKKGLQITPLLSFDDFTYLAGLFDKESLSKMELIERNIHEKTSGIEIIKRLQKKGLIDQYDDPFDKQSKRLFLTPPGREELMKAFPIMAKVATTVSGNLSDNEKMQLFYLLYKLHAYHKPVYLKERDIE